MAKCFLRKLTGYYVKSCDFTVILPVILPLFTIFFVKSGKITIKSLEFHHCTTSNLRKHFKDSKQAEWKRILKVEKTKTDKLKINQRL